MGFAFPITAITRDDGDPGDSFDLRSSAQIRGNSAFRFRRSRAIPAIPSPCTGYVKKPDLSGKKSLRPK
jgi:hypothetical protein